MYAIRSYYEKVAFIHEERCIGCTKCLQACPVDAILGAPKLMHTILREECTGCDLCVDPCPTNCIEMIEVPTTRITSYNVCYTKLLRSSSWVWLKA